MGSRVALEHILSSLSQSFIYPDGSIAGHERLVLARCDFSWVFEHVANIATSTFSRVVNVSVLVRVSVWRTHANSMGVVSDARVVSFAVQLVNRNLLSVQSLFQLHLKDVLFLLLRIASHIAELLTTLILGSSSS